MRGRARTPTRRVQVFSKTPLQYAVYGEDQQILRWMEAEMAWDPEPGEEGRFLRGQERKYSDVRQVLPGPHAPAVRVVLSASSRVACPSMVEPAFGESACARTSCRSPRNPSGS